MDLTNFGNSSRRLPRFLVGERLVCVRGMREE